MSEVLARQKWTQNRSLLEVTSNCNANALEISGGDFGSEKKRTLAGELDSKEIFNADKASLGAFAGRPTG